ncbi:GspH/FimT family pseudopilin [Massilia sp. CCM 8734]|uniref:GspH/FimT family pseudopilin n=1 Tax=Massilia sp. CCM 8734 TaxID=2609283 RepID=UPI00169372A0|nr:GspH/FimT family pseudopilin [Massilia sp. CCM 8734]NHZ97332.1 prepilin-type N-terminal cleavage/methylation domain-containing protein [Massilia sp. CCM 8734]
MVARAQPRQGGFTVLELMAVISMLAVLSAIAAPAFSEMLGKSRLRSASSDLFTAMLRARSEAIDRRVDVTVRATTEGAWHSGWSISDPSKPGGLIESYKPVVNATISGPASVTFKANGRLRPGQRPSFEFSANGVASHLCLQLDLSGRPVQKKTACKS